MESRRPIIPKPRRTKGTPVFVYRNYFALGVISVGVIYGVLFHFSSGAERWREKLDPFLSVESEESKRRTFAFSRANFPLIHTDILKENIEQEEERRDRL